MSIRRGSVRHLFPVALGALLSLGPATYLHAQERPRVAVLPFENHTDWWGRQLGASAASQLTVGLVNSGAFSVLERQQVEQIFDEWYRGQTGAITESQAAEIGQLLGAEYLITGEFTSFNVQERGGGLNLGGRQIGASETRAESAMNVRVINVVTGEIVAAVQAEGNEVVGRGLTTSVVQTASRTEYNQTIADQALGPAITKIVSDLVSFRDRMPSTGVAMAALPAATLPSITGTGSDDSIYIDAGEDEGITVGMRFHVVRVIDVIRDQDGNPLDEITDHVGIVEVTRVLSQSSIASVVEGSVQIDDRLDRVEQN